MKKIASYIVVLLILTGCSGFAEDGAAINSTIPVAVTLTFTTNELESNSRSLTESQESALNNINVYMFSKSSEKKYHVYTSNTDLPLTVIPGTYTTYVIGNMNADMGDIDEQQLNDYKYDYTNPDETGYVIMSNKQDITITPNSISLSLLLYRNIAKINLSLSIAAGVDISLRSMQLVNTPKSAYLINNNNTPSAKESDYNSGEEIALSTNNYTGSFYLFENKQGIVSSITNQTLKNKKNAPQYATYLHITAVSNMNPNTTIEYFVYLGENNTSDFNIGRNTLQNVNITIKGISTVDTRIETTTINHQCDATYMYWGQTITGNINALSSSPDRQFTGVFNVMSGNSNDYYLFKVGSTQQQPGTYFPIGATTAYSFSYSPAVMTSANNNVQYKVTAVDGNGSAKEFVKSLPCYFKVNLSVTPEGAGTITPPTGYIQKEGNNYFYAPTATNTENRTVSIVPKLGEQFDGWYVDGIQKATNTSCDFKINANLNVTAKFKNINLIRLNYIENNCSFEAQYPVISDVVIYLEYCIDRYDWDMNIVDSYWYSDEVVIKTGTKLSQQVLYIDPCYTQGGEQTELRTYTTSVIDSQYIYKIGKF